MELKLTRKKILVVVIAIVAAIAALVLYKVTMEQVQEPVESDPLELATQVTELSEPIQASKKEVLDFIDVPDMPIGQFAFLYSRTGNILVCDDLLNDTRRLSIKLSFDNIQHFRDILRAYGYGSYHRNGIEVFCDSGDRIGDKTLLYYGKYLNDRNHEEVFIEVREEGQRTQWLAMTEFIDKFNLIVRFNDCAYNFYNGKSGGMLRRVVVPDCLSGLSNSNRGTTSVFSNSVRSNSGGVNRQASNNAAQVSQNTPSSPRSVQRVVRRSNVARTSVRALNPVNESIVDDFKPKSKFKDIANSAAPFID